MYNYVRNMLSVKNGVTKDYISNELNISQREVRKIVSKISQNSPVIAHCGKKGYRIPDLDNISKEEVEYALMELDRTIGELNSRIIEINKRIKPLVKFKKDLLSREIYGGNKIGQ